MDGSDPAILVVTDLADLVALDKALREAKFSSDPNDLTLAASPLVANLSRRVRAALHAQRSTSGPQAEEDPIQPNGPEWTASKQAALRLRTWSTWVHQQKLTVARDLLSPFAASAMRLEQFVAEVDSAPEAG